MYVASPFEQKLFDERDRIIGGERQRHNPSPLRGISHQDPLREVLVHS